MKNYYDVLGLPPDADMQMIKTAYKKLSSFSHPDMVSPGHKKWAEERQKELNEAYMVLSNPETRYEYDRAAGFHNYQQEAMRGRRPENNQSDNRGQRADSQFAGQQNPGSRVAAARAVESKKQVGLSPLVYVGAFIVGAVVLGPIIAPLIGLAVTALLAIGAFFGVVVLLETLFGSK